LAFWGAGASADSFNPATALPRRKKKNHLWGGKKEQGEKEGTAKKSNDVKNGGVSEG